MKLISRILHSGRGVKAPAFFLLLVALVISLFAYDDYGIAWDEPWQVETTQVNYRYIFEGDETLLTHEENIYGMAVELPLLLIQNVLGLEDSRDIYLMRHLVSHLLWLLGIWFFILMVYRVFRKNWLAILAGLFLYLSPRIFAHSFFNTKDLPFLVFCILSAYAFLKTHQKVWPNVIWFGIISGLLINVRMMGVLIVVLGSLFIFLKYLSTKDLRQAFLIPAVYLTITFLVLWAGWPFLWEAPFKNLAEAFRIMSKYPWDDLVLYFGKQLPAPELPWHYSLGWIAISTPILYLVLFCAGFVSIIKRISTNAQNIFTDSHRVLDLFHLMLIFLSLLVVILLSSTLYDDYRQLYYIYPSFLFIAVSGAWFIHSKLKAKWLRRLFLVAIVAGLLSPALFMVQNHPHQQVYLNLFISREQNHIRKNFEMDYWGLSYRQALEYILESDQSDMIKVMVANQPGIDNVDILDPADRARLDVRFYHPSPDYFISNYRFHPEDYPYGEPEFEIIILGSPIVSVWSMD